MLTRKLIMYDILVTYYKNYSNKPKELISRSTDLTYKKEIAVVFALSMVDDINRTKKKLLSVVGCNGKEYCSLKAEDFGTAKRRKAIRKILSKLLEESDVVFMTFSYADNKTVEVVINKTKHNHHYA